MVPSPQMLLFQFQILLFQTNVLSVAYEKQFSMFLLNARDSLVFSRLTLVFSLFNVFFSEKVFIFGAGYNKNHIFNW